jgi:type IV pilus assembly protein PilA
MKTLQKGFTLIELLVVIAIIGILSSIVLASLSSARSKGSDAAITSTLSNMRAQAELYYSHNGGYATTTAVATTCYTGIFNDSGTGGLKNLTLDLISKSGVTAGNVTCAASTTAWAVNAKLSSTGWACVDGGGNSVASSTKTSGYVITTGLCK